MPLAPACLIPNTRADTRSPGPTGWFEGVTGTGDYGGAVTGDVGML
jgi:hypothetical protein